MFACVKKNFDVPCIVICLLGINCEYVAFCKAHTVCVWTEVVEAL